ncbi:MAG TPA: hypothetical protein VKB81_03195 [Nitrospira sp.]|nr:hypothetical protein [Nitrospira sp.]
MEPARKLDQPRIWDSPSTGAPKPREPERIIGESGRVIEQWEITLGKIIFYLTVAASVWFFYWLNGIQCPC